MQSCKFVIIIMTTIITDAARRVCDAEFMYNGRVSVRLSVCPIERHLSLATAWARTADRPIDR